MADRDINNLDDLISSSGGDPIIVQESGSDKKFLYTLLILLVILFIIAMGIIAYLGSKYFGNNDNKNITQHQTAQMPIAKQDTIKKDEVSKKAVEVAKESKNDTLNELENLVKEEEKSQQNSKASSPKKEETKRVEAKKVEAKTTQNSQAQTIAKVATTAAGGKNLSEKDLEKIAKLVAQELSKKAKSKQSSSNNSDKALVASLESANTDTLKNQQVNTTKLKDTKVNNSSSKKVDTFNKVVIKKQNNKDDEFAQLSSEIDAILQSKEVTKEEKSLKYGKELKQEIVRREKELRYIVVKKGDTLSSLAKKAYGRASAYTKIYEANPDLIKNPNRIYIGMKLRVPVDEEYNKQQGK